MKKNYGEVSFANSVLNYNLDGTKSFNVRILAKITSFSTKKVSKDGYGRIKIKGQGFPKMK